jgi:DNA-binding response OmpR family regulator
MGPLTGVDLVRQLRSHGRAPRCVIMTGNTAFEMPADLRDVGLLEKPFPVASLLAALGLQPPQ